MNHLQFIAKIIFCVVFICDSGSIKLSLHLASICANNSYVEQKHMFATIEEKQK